jgi:hypothetical protein
MVTPVTVATMTIMRFSLALGLILTLALIGLLVARELAAAGNGLRAICWAQVLSIGIAPLLASFVVILGVKIGSVL